MAERPFWRGYLNLSPVTCTVQMEPARTASDNLTFHTINRKTGHRVESRYVDADTEEPVDDEDQVKGYPVSDDRHVMIEDEEFEAVALESTRTIDIESFVPAGDIGCNLARSPHFLKPGDKVGEEAFAVIRAAMAPDRGGERVLLGSWRSKGGWDRTVSGFGLPPMQEKKSTLSKI